MRRNLVKIFSQEQMDRIDAVIEEYRNIPGSLLILLEKTQDISLYLPYELQRYIARKLGLPASRVSGVVTFYSYFSTAPRGRSVIKVCTGTACYVKRAAEIKERLQHRIGVGEGEVTPDGEYSIEEVRCLGACGLAPVVVVGRETFGLVNPDQVEEMIGNVSERR